MRVGWVGVVVCVRVVVVVVVCVGGGGGGLQTVEKPRKSSAVDR